MVEVFQELAMCPDIAPQDLDVACDIGVEWPSIEFAHSPNLSFQLGALKPCSNLLLGDWGEEPNWHRQEVGWSAP